MLFKSKKGMQISTKIWLTYFWIAGFLKLVSTRPNWGAQETQLWGPKSNLPSIPFIASLLCYTIFHWTFEVVSVGPNVSSEAICRHIWLQVEPPTSDICALVSILTFKMYFSVFTPFSLYLKKKNHQENSRFALALSRVQWIPQDFCCWAFVYFLPDHLLICMFLTWAPLLILFLLPWQLWCPFGFGVFVWKKKQLKGLRNLL